MLHIVSASSPVPSEIFAFLALLSVSVVVLLILRHYLPLRTTPAFYLVPIFFALWLPACIVLLVPIDLASSARTDDEATRGVWLPQRVLLVSWRISYWLTFALTWFILPILGEYSDSGYREPKDSLMYSLRQNAQYHIMVLGTAGIGLAYLFITYNPSLTAIKTSFMALAYFYGLVFAIYLMGHGLVSIPRRLFRYSSISGRLRRLQTRAPKLYEKMEDSLLNLEDVELQVSELGRRKTGSAVKFSEWIDELVETANLPESHPRSSTLGVSAESRNLPTVITEKFMADLTRKLMRARHARSRYVNEWNDLLKEASETQAILDSAASKKLESDAPSPHGGFWDRFTVHTPYTRYLYYYHVEPYASIALGAFLAAASALIIWSEVIKAAFPQLSVIRLTVVHHWVGEKGQVGFAGQVISVFWLLYMCAATFITMTEVKTWRGRALVRRNTAYESAFWYAGQVAKLSVPLSYNFMTFLSSTIYKKTRFYDFLGRLIDFSSISRWADYLFPIFVLVPVVATLFGLYGKIKRMFGFGGDFIDEDEGDGRIFGTGSWREGRDLIERELGGNSALRRREEAFARLEGAGRSAPVLTIPGGRSGAAASPARSPTRATQGRRPGQPSRTTPYRDEEPEEENFFESLGHRMKNTIDTFEPPQWFQDIKKPKWMGGDDDEPGSGSGGVGGGVESDIRRWFGGEGRVRL
ncbi:lmbr1 domain-containing protein [Colletotrichum truncatum]|uniref:Lmbr1 domain-containing protein n=1 Tax=Colletotrichum truncatum TaxID=5467 RepID=A0ACC3YIG5_COLTU|nr:lmbr1 domain-containing protein [Colletotrichum truncatum]KAF6794443.1 lmbr1 domain-containing protein [Colletotrichum truncatum]